MTDTPGPMYEVTFDVDPGVVGEFDLWLAEHVSEMQRRPGIYQAEAFEQEGDDEGRARRELQFYFSDYADLERYLSEQAAADRQALVDRFGAQFSIKSRVLRQSNIIERRPTSAESCLNCGTTLGGQYCPNCGQRSTSRLISIWELVKDAFGDLFELDSRLWNTLVPLVIRPGRLTRDYLLGRRARYMPPFRMYLVLSVVFFLVAFFDPREKLPILFEAVETPAAESPDQTSEGQAIRDEFSRELRQEGIVVGSSDGDVDDNCSVENIKIEGVPDWIARRFTPERLSAACYRVTADDKQAFLSDLLDNVPAALFVLLPLMAFVLKILYPLSKRYYVEHLLFVVHYHAFVFLILSLNVLASQLGALALVPELPFDVLSFAMTLYVPVYLYKAQRRVYEQGRFVTILKFLMLAMAYLGGLIFIFLMVAIFAAFSA